MKRKLFRKAESAWCLRREEPRHCLEQGGYCESSYPSLQLLETPVCIVNFCYNIHPRCSWPSGWEKMAVEVGLCRGESRFIMHKDLLSSVPLRTVLLLSCRLLVFVGPEENPSWGNCEGDLSN